MLDLVVYLTLCGSFLTLLLIVLIIIRGNTRRNEPDEEPKQILLSRPISSDLPSKARKRRVRQRAEQSRVSEAEGYDEDDEEIKMTTLPIVEGKIGTKKAKKLERKEEKRAMRIQEEEEREERKKKQALIEEKRRLVDEKREQEEKEREEIEKRAKEEKERQEYEEYLKLKAEFELEEEGFDQSLEEDMTQNKLQAFIEFIKEKKVVLLEDLAANFMMKTQDAINRLNQLLEDEQITGIIDDRGKFIYITEEELYEIAKFIKKRGRVSISELVENSNNLINIQSQC